MKKGMDQLDTLRGLCALTGVREPDWVMAEPQGVEPREAAWQCVVMLRELAQTYGGLAQDPHDGGLFRILSEETWGMVGQMLRVVQRMG